MIRVYAKIVGDLFHHGHVNFFKRLRENSDHLTIHVVDDQRVKVFKRAPIMTQKERIAVISSCKFVDEVASDGPKIITCDFMIDKNYQFYGFSFKDERELRIKRADCPDLPESMLRIVKYTDDISTTELIERVLSRKVSAPLMTVESLQN